MLYHERQAKRRGFCVIIGIDEAGRGPLAGPVVAAAVCLRSFRFKGRIDDSKKLTPRQREESFLEIAEKSCFGIGVVNEGAIDELNISRAAQLAVDNAVLKLLKKFPRGRPSPKNTFLLLDGRLRSDLRYPSKEIIGGDGLSLSIACASIVAKVVRDRIMAIYDSVYPLYGFKIHKGYGTERHRRLLKQHGLCPIHRKSFCSAYA